MTITRVPGGMRLWRAGRLALSGRRRPGPGTPAVPVDAEHHPDLYELVVDAARRVGAPPPERTRLAGPARVTARGRTLAVGLPLVYGLSADQLRAVVAHELALPPTRYPRLVGRLLALRAEAAGQGTDAAAALLRATRALHDAVEQVRDAAAIEAMGGGFAAVEDAALAVYRAETLADRFEQFAMSAGAYRLGTDRYRIEDLHAGWRHHLRRSGATGTGGDEPRRDHPGLAAEIQEIMAGAAGDAPDGATAAEADERHRPAAVPVEALRPGQERDLAAEALGPAAAGEEPAWCRYADLPAAVYSGDVEHSARRLVEAVESVLGRPPDDRDELVDTLLRRAGEVHRAKAAAGTAGTVGPAGDPGAAADPPPWLGPAYLATVVEYTLTKQGWRREHPAVSHVLVSPDTMSTVDLAELVAKPDELRRHLNDASGTAA